MDDALKTAPDAELSAAEDDKLTAPFTVKLADGDLADLDRVVDWERRNAKPGYIVTRASLARAALRIFLSQKLKRIES